MSLSKFEIKKKRLERFPLQGVISYSCDDENESFSISIDFEEKNFLSILSFIKEKIGEDQRIIVNGRVRFRNRSFSEGVDFSNCTFSDHVFLTDCEFKKEVYFKRCIFQNKLVLDKSIFYSKVRFHTSIFEKTVSFENTQFHNLLDFYHAHFKDDQQFWLTDFFDITIFSNVTFYEQVQFLYCKVSEKTYISFENAEFRKALDISRANFWCRIQVWGVKIAAYFEDVWLYETDSLDEEEEKNKGEALKRMRESYRRLKQEFLLDNNNIEALRIQKYEMEVYRRELKEKGSFWKNAEDRIILFFNNWSNSFGKSWTRGLIFTLVFACFFYLLFLATIADKISFDWNGKGEFLKYLAQFLNLAYWEYKPYGVTDYTWGYLVLFIGRIFIGYGFYQTIQAFRKFGKNN